MKTIFLLCALALPPNDKVRFHQLKDFFEKYRPGYSIVLIHVDEYPIPPIGGEYEMTPFQFQGLQVWLKISA